MPHWVCNDCGGHFPQHLQEHRCTAGLGGDEKKRMLQKYTKRLLDQVELMHNEGDIDDWLDDYQLFVLEKFKEELERWLS